MYIDYGTEFSIEKFSHIPTQSQEDADAQSMPVDSQTQPEEQQAAVDEAQESCANDDKTSVENEDINEKAAEAYNIYLERHPEMSIEEQIVEAEEKLNDIAKNSKVNKAKQSKLKIDEKLKRQAERKHDPALDDPKEAAKRSQIEKHKKEAREEYMRRHSMEFFGFGKKKEIIKTLDEIKTSSNYEKGLKDLVNKTFKNAWNYKAYKLPKWYKNTEYGDMGFEEKISLFEGNYDAIEYVKNNKYIIELSGIFSFAFGQPTEYEIYNKTLNDIQKRWETRLLERAKDFEPKLKEIYPDSELSVSVGIGDGDEGAVYPEIKISVPVSYFE